MTNTLDTALHLKDEIKELTMGANAVNARFEELDFSQRPIDKASH